jgi:hypothetical protein
MASAAEIARIDMIIADAESRIERQRQLMAKLSAAGKATEEAELTLGLMLGTLDYLRQLRLDYVVIRKDNS